MEFTQSKTQFTIFEFIAPIFSKAKDLYSHYIQAPVWMLANTPNAVIQKTVQASNWVFKTSAPSFITSYFQVLQNFNPFNSKTWRLITPSSADTSFSIGQIKQDLHRMDIYVNNLRCETIEDFTMRLGLTLNTAKTDILPTDNPLIPKILHFSHQGLYQSGYSAFRTHVGKYNGKFPAPATEEPLSIHISWDPSSPETTEIIGEVSFHIKFMTTGSILPCIYTVKTKCFLDKEEITWKAFQEERDIESSFVFVETLESESFEALEEGGSE